MSAGAVVAWTLVVWVVLSALIVWAAWRAACEAEEIDADRAFKDLFR